MKTDELIHELGRDLRPVRRLPPPGRRAAWWLSGGALYVAALAGFAWARRGHLGVELAAPDLTQQVTLALTSVLAAVAAFASVSPGTISRSRAALMLPLGAMMAALVWGVARDVQESGSIGLGRETDWPCVVSTTIGTIVLWGMASAMLRRGAVLEPRMTAVLAGAAAVSLANIEACVGRAHAFTATVIVWHGVTAAVLMLGVLTLGPRLLTRRRAS